jgi:hypothetical protein
MMSGAGTYDLATNKWTKLNTRPIDPELQMMSALHSDEGELVRLRRLRMLRSRPITLGRIRSAALATGT